VRAGATGTGANFYFAPADEDKKKQTDDFRLFFCLHGPQSGPAGRPARDLFNHASSL
jgi:hypothetical protein